MHEDIIVACLSCGRVHQYDFLNIILESYTDRTLKVRQHLLHLDAVLVHYCVCFCGKPEFC